ncbi:MAG: DNA-binding protein [Rhodopseudomonas palustris]|nr:MAG: DNA-binding protein [Rhodopseudomonas palustris]
MAVDFPYGHTRGLRELDGVPVGLSEDDRAAMAALRSEYDKLEAEYAGADELPGEVDQRLGEIETALSAFDTRPVIYDPAEIARAGVFVSIDSEGVLSVDRGYVRPDDEAPVIVDLEAEFAAGDESVPDDANDVAAPRAVITIGGATAEPEDDEDDVIKPLPDRLVTELTAHRTLALRNALANDPAVAFTAVLHNFVLSTFYRFATCSGCMEIAIRTPMMPAQAAGLNDSVSAKAVEARHDAWKVRLPREEGDLWDALIGLDATEQSSLFAHCASFGVNALYEPASRFNEGRVSAHSVRRRLDHADVLACAVGLDMVAAGWTTGVDNYLGRVTKPRILEAVREAKGESSAQLIGHLKKADMAREAERLLEGTGWLPEPLRLTDAETATVTGEAEALPEFLADDDEDQAEADEDQPRVIAAE